MFADSFTGGVPVIEVSALATLCVVVHQVVKYLLARGAKVDDQQSDAVEAAQREVTARVAELIARIEGLEAKVKHLEEENSAERHRKHEAMAEAATYLGTLRVTRHIVQVAEPAELPGMLSPLLEKVP